MRISDWSSDVCSSDLTQVQQTLDPAALYQAQMAMRDGLPQATTPTPLNPNAFADMVERHLKQMATDRGAAADAGDGRVLLRMADATLPGPDLLLSRTSAGWVLRASAEARRVGNEWVSKCRSRWSRC